MRKLQSHWVGHLTELLLHFVVDNWLNHVLNFLVSLILVSHDALHIVKQHLSNFSILCLCIGWFLITLWWCFGFLCGLFLVIEIDWYYKLSLLFLVFLFITCTLLFRLFSLIFVVVDFILLFCFRLFITVLMPCFLIVLVLFKCWILFFFMLFLSQVIVTLFIVLFLLLFVIFR